MWGSRLPLFTFCDGTVSQDINHVDGYLCVINYFSGHSWYICAANWCITSIWQLKTCMLQTEGNAAPSQLLQHPYPKTRATLSLHIRHTKNRPSSMTPILTAVCRSVCYGHCDSITKITVKSTAEYKLSSQFNFFTEWPFLTCPHHHWKLRCNSTMALASKSLFTSRSIIKTDCCAFQK